MNIFPVTEISLLILFKNILSLSIQIQYRGILYKWALITLLKPAFITSNYAMAIKMSLSVNGYTCTVSLCCNPWDHRVRHNLAPEEQQKIQMCGCVG